MVENAIATVSGFEKVFSRLERQVTLWGKSKSILNNYIRRIAKVCLHFGKLSEQINDDELREYLTSVAMEPKSLHAALLNTRCMGFGITSD